MIGARFWDGWEIGSKARTRIGNRQTTNSDIYPRTFRAKDPSVYTDFPTINYCPLLSNRWLSQMLISAKLFGWPMIPPLRNDLLCRQENRDDRQRNRSLCRRKLRESATSVRTISIRPARDTRYTANRRRAGVEGHPRSVEIRSSSRDFTASGALESGTARSAGIGSREFPTDPDYIKIKRPAHSDGRYGDLVTFSERWRG